MRLSRFVNGFSTIVVMLGRAFVLLFCFMLMLAYVLALYKVGAVESPEINLVWFSLMILGGDWVFERFVRYWRTKGNGHENQGGSNS